MIGCGDSGSGYGTSSGTIRSMTDTSQTTSPPPRSMSTSLSSSARWSLIDSVRPVLKNTISARAGAAASTSSRAASVIKRRRQRAFPFIWSLPHIDERVKDADAELARILAARVQHCRHVGLVDRDRELGDVTCAKLRHFQRNFAEVRLFRLQREFVDDLPAQADTHMLRLVEHAAGIIEIEIEQRVFLRVLESQRGFLLRPLPLDRRVVLGDFGRMPALLEHREDVFRLRLQLELRHLVGMLPGIVAGHREPFLSGRRMQSDPD